ncbi:MAG: prephenate dehydrogenase/arogenate dehydrogenase family protein [Methylococcaceae bacterium]|nr:prephenate dehydrogenase/arogenate dehydrogenase family protein [Methylococcaceae bacterium]MDP2394690.1 prephenate dehydrogenase/arogenate dehydrogenase family protein [Methylococcaceae bacterium]MDP3017999.1 prephenate dehydrogenase/arogenate dehydrogenase family protein [Methylococcaceae bacterium]MDP3389692.1 prephenate dehydrogenase/arogenate dehydrogenase family protein [Methylococcaceae bacterium]MDZ4219161.1 prephenate dehydrogenase/arogenate dehydrogenase family protein [Methylobact
MFDRLCIIGVGLIGGSIARAARLNGLSQTIVGFGRPEDLANLQTAKQLGVIDEYYLDLAEAVKNVDCVVIATPVASIKAIFTLLQPLWSAQTIYTDVGSTKGSVLVAAEQVFGEIPPNLVPAHPIAGAEQSGVEASLDDLFVGKRLIITPTDNTSPQALQAIKTLWEKLGSLVSVMDAKHHDGVLAATSHLPHLLAFALVDMLGRKDEQNEIFKYAAGGFRDFTRIASSDPTMWLDICLANRDELIPLIEELKTELGVIQNTLQNQNGQQLFQTFTYAKNARQRFLDQFEN